MANDIYGPGGMDPNMPHENLRERWDDASQTYTDFRVDPPASRPYGALEIADAERRAVEDAAPTNRSAIESAAKSAHVSNKTFLALDSPTNAQLAAQVKALTRQNNGLIRLVLKRLDGTD